MFSVDRELLYLVFARVINATKIIQNLWEKSSINDCSSRVGGQQTNAPNLLGGANVK